MKPSLNGASFTGMVIDDTIPVLDQSARVLAAVRAFRNKTSLTIAQAAQLDRFIVARRLPELAKRGLVVKSEAEVVCPVSGRKAHTWKPSP